MDELYIIARRVLLDALEALDEHRHATILVGAQALYLHSANADFAVAEYTTDADLALDPTLLSDIPPLENALEVAGFYSAKSAVGIWKTHRQTSEARNVDVQVDLLVPATVSPGSGRRAARLPGHGIHAARKVDGLEGALVDHAERDIPSLEPAIDPRVIRAKVAGPGALLIAKIFKIHERRGSVRANDKDALDVLRLLQAIPTTELAQRLDPILADERSAATGAGAGAVRRPLREPWQRGRCDGRPSRSAHDGRRRSSPREPGARSRPARRDRGLTSTNERMERRPFPDCPGCQTDAPGPNPSKRRSTR